MRPLIGITGRRIEFGLLRDADHRYADRHVDQFFADFAHGVDRAGGIPVHLPFEAGTSAALERFDGLIVSGGQDVHPRFWGGDESVVRPDADPRRHPSVHDVDRDGYELELVRAAVATRVPLLGVCRGHQVLNVAFGGTLVPDLPPGPVQHLLLSAAPSDGGTDHVVRFAPGSLAESVYGERARTNAWHHQAVAICGRGVVATGWTPDGVVEAIEVPGWPVLGVQWHPEWQVTPDPALAWIVAAAAVRAGARGASSPCRSSEVTA